MGMKPIPSLPLPPALRLLRIHHWIKSGFIAAPLFFSPGYVTPENIYRVGLGILFWSLLASAIYILNDWRDRDSDREHPSKKNRPLAAGTVSPQLACFMMIALAGIAAVGSYLLSPVFAMFLLTYAIMNTAYSLRLKHVAVIDVMCIALGFVLRVEAGAELIKVDPSAWIVIMTGLLALFLGFAKRRDDIVKHLSHEHRKSLDGYSRNFIDTTLAITLGAVLVSYLIYTTDPEVMERLGSHNLYYTAPFVIYGMLRYLQITLVKERSGSPTLIVLTDKPILLAGIGWVLTFGWLIYR